MLCSFTSAIRIWSSKQKASWHFCSTPPDITSQIEDFAHILPTKRGRRSIPVTVRIGFYVWQTSIFPDTKTHTYLLPLKKEVRKDLSIQERDTIEIELELLS